MSPSLDLAGLVRAAGERIGERPFFTAAGTTYGGREFCDRVQSIASGLVAAGFRRGDRLAILLHRSVDEAAALLAAAVAGGIAVPVGAKLKDQQIAHLLGDAEPFAVVTSAVRLLALRDPAELLTRQRLFCSGHGPLPLPSEPLPERGPKGTDAAHATNGAELPTPAAEDAAVLLYTSGSTGLAKGVVQNHRNLALGAAIVADYTGLVAADHLLALLPLSFDYGLNQLLAALHSGSRITVADHLGAGELAELLLEVRPTGLAGVPSLWHEVARALQSGALGTEHGASLRFITNSGGALRRADSLALRSAWPKVSVFAMYGLTEAFRSAYLEPAEFDRYPESFGRAIAGVELLLVDTGSGAVLEGPGTGELVHAGALVAQGYWQRPEETAARFRSDPRGGGGRDSTVVYSGDLVRRDEGGRHWFVGRLDRMLKVQGHRVSPDEIAAAFAGTPGIGEVFAYGEDGGAEGHRVVLVVAADVAAGSGAALGELRRTLLQRGRARLPSYMQPGAVHVLPALPHNQHGKVDEAALRAKINACTENH